jgi:ribosome-dependent ATPase
MPATVVSTTPEHKPVVSIRDVSHHYGKVLALDRISLDIPSGIMVGMIGPDGAGKSTLLALLAGSKKMQEGQIDVLGGDMKQFRHRHSVCPRIAYMPQGLGKNLYLELSVYDNVDFMAQLFGLLPSERPRRVKELLDATGLGPFPDRPAGKLSGGMKQKVGLCGALVHEPDLLVLDEPTTGVDPLSRRQFWTLIDDIRKTRPGMSVVVSTAYMEEAQQWDWVIAMDGGQVLATGTPAALMARTGSKDLDHCFISLLPEEKRRGHVELVIPPRPATEKPEIAIEAHGLTQRFGSFTAVDHVSLEIERGEIFGFLGSNGCGKSTTMKMLTGLLPPTEGTATLFGKSVDAGSMEVRRNLGYMTQSFSLYGELTVRANLELDARLFQIPPEKAKARIDELVERFGLGPHLSALADSLPFGVKQRLSLAVAVLHNPILLILDEPTSGVDPVARDGFWEMLLELSRKEGVTIFITTHFMNEGMRCDRISLMNAGKVLACDAPQKLIDARGAKNLEDAFIGYMEEAIAKQTPASTQAKETGSASAATGATPSAAAPAHKKAALPLPLRRLLAYTHNEAIQIVRDPVRLAFAFLGSAVLMFVCGFGITTDVLHIKVTALDRDQSQDSRTYIEQFRSIPRYFRWEPPTLSDDDALKRLQADEVSTVIEIPPNFSRDLHRGDTPDVLAQIDGANPLISETIKQYVEGAQSTLLADPGNRFYVGPNCNSVWATGAPVLATGAERSRAAACKYSANFQERYIYNPTFESIYSIVPSVPAILLMLFPAVLMTVSIVREKELGSMINFYVTPTGRLEYLVGKQLPYLLIGMINFFILVTLALLVFDVPIKGSFLFLTLCTLVYVIVTTGIGMVTSTFTNTQVAAVFATAILTIQPSIQYSGMLQPVGTLQGSARAMGTIWPTTYYMHASLGAYTKGLGLDLMMNDMLYLLACIPVLLLLSMLGLRKQEK